MYVAALTRNGLQIKGPAVIVLVRIFIYKSPISCWPHFILNSLVIAGHYYHIRYLLKNSWVLSSGLPSSSCLAVSISPLIATIRFSIVVKLASGRKKLVMQTFNTRSYRFGSLNLCKMWVSWKMEEESLEGVLLLGICPPTIDFSLLSKNGFQPTLITILCTSPSSTDAHPQYTPVAKSGGRFLTTLIS